MRLQEFGEFLERDSSSSENNSEEEIKNLLNKNTDENIIKAPKSKKKASIEEKDMKDMIKENEIDN